MLIFIGNEIAFDGSIIFDSILNQPRVFKPKNICGKRITNKNLINKRKIVSTHGNVQFHEYGTPQHCKNCKYTNNLRQGQACKGFSN